MNFEKAFTLLFGNEGGFQKEQNDDGNWTGGSVGKGILKGTKFGISAASYPGLDIENLTVEQAKWIYLRDFWNVLKLDKVPEIVRFDLFDTAVNSGVKTAVKILQRAIGVDDDGIFGNNTIIAVSAFVEKGDNLDKRFAAQRLLYLVSCKNWPIYARTWVKRVANNLLND